MRRFATLWKYAYILYTLYILLRMSSPPQLKEDEWNKNSRWGSIKYILILIWQLFVLLLFTFCASIVFVSFLFSKCFSLGSFNFSRFFGHFSFHLSLMIVSSLPVFVYFVISFILFYNFTMASSNFHEFVTSDFSFYTLFSYDKKTVLPKDCTMYIICFVLF